MVTIGGRRHEVVAGQDFSMAPNKSRRNDVPTYRL